MDLPPRSIEQIEVIERHVTEGRRPRVPGKSALPTTTIQTFSETFELPKDEDLLRRRRYELTGETDVSRDASFVHASANYGQELDTTMHDRSGGSGGAFSVNTYGYDVHELHTSEGGARIVETHGGGYLDDSARSRLDDSITTVRPSVAALSAASLASAPPPPLRRSPDRFVPTTTAPPLPVATAAPLARGESWRQLDDSFTRKDSYRQMQTSQESKDAFGGMSRSPIHLRSRQSLVSGSRQDDDEGGGCWARTKRFFAELMQTFRNAEVTPALLANLCCILLLLLLLLILVIIVLSALFNRYSVREYLLFPPVCEECRRRNPNLLTASMPSSVFVHYYSANQAHFELRGNPPFHSNVFTAIDFTTGYVAYADHALTDAAGRHTTCFLMPLDRTAIPSMDALMDALGQSDYEIQSTFGWQEFWQFAPEPIDSMAARAKFSEEVLDCTAAKWMLLRQTVAPRDSSCSDCYDFCLPDWAVVRRVKYEDEATLGVRRLNCFRYYVPEWRDFSIKTDVTGGHWQYPLTSHSTKRDKNGEWVDWLPTSGTMDAFSNSAS